MPPPTFRRYDPAADEAALVDLLTTETWAFRLKPHLSEEEVRETLGDYDGHDDITELVFVDKDLTGFVRAFEIGDDHSDPQLDYRFRERFRGQGLGTAATHHIVRVVFEEAVYRRAWPAGDEHLDGIGYALLRSDWETGTVTPVDWS